MDNKLSSIAIIPDGNRRYALKKKISTEEAYLAGFRKSEEAMKWCYESHIKTLTYWALSLDNFSKRSPGELDLLFKMMKGHAQNTLRSETLHQNNVKVRFFGKRDLLPAELNQIFNTVEQEYSKGALQLNFGIAYNGREELVHVARSLAADVAAGKLRATAIGEHEFEKYLYLNESPDLVIRTGNAPRLSGLMPWQTVYSELYFIPKLWPEFTKRDFQAAIDFYDGIERKFGK